MAHPTEPKSFPFLGTTSSSVQAVCSGISRPCLTHGLGRNDWIRKHRSNVVAGSRQHGWQMMLVVEGLSSFSWKESLNQWFPTVFPDQHHPDHLETSCNYKSLGPAIGLLNQKSEAVIICAFIGPPMFQHKSNSRTSAHIVFYIQNFTWLRQTCPKTKEWNAHCHCPRSFSWPSFTLFFSKYQVPILKSLKKKGKMINYT